MKKGFILSVIGFAMLSMGIYVYSQNKKTKTDEVLESASLVRKVLDTLDTQLEDWQRKSTEISHLLPAHYSKWKRDRIEKWEAMKQAINQLSSLVKMSQTSPEMILELRKKSSLIAHLKTISQQIIDAAQKSKSEKEYIVKVAFTVGDTIVTHNILQELQPPAIKETPSEENEIPYFDRGYFDSPTELDYSFY